MVSIAGWASALTSVGTEALGEAALEKVGRLKLQIKPRQTEETLFMDVSRNARASEIKFDTAHQGRG